MKYQRFTPSGYNNIGIRKFELVGKNQFKKRGEIETLMCDSANLQNLLIGLVMVLILKLKFLSTFIKR